jgi:hypothetical protein
MNKTSYPDAYQKSRTIGLKLARLMAITAMIQITADHFFLIENPAGSELFQLPEFRDLWNTGKVGKITFPQCTVGLKTPEGLPILKLTELWSNAKELLEPFAGLKCDHDQHGDICGQYNGQQRSKLAQVWPPEMCRMIVEGSCMLLKRIGTVKQRCILGFPVEDKKKGRPRKYPELAIFDCPACKSSKPWSDPQHSRNAEPPLLCKHSDKTLDSSCPASSLNFSDVVVFQGCLQGKSPDHPNHTRIKGECRMPGIRTTGQRRRGGPVRDPAVSAAGSSADRNRVTADSDLDRDQENPMQDSTGRLCEEPGEIHVEDDDRDAPLPREEIEGVTEQEGDSELAPATARERRIRVDESSR